MILTEICGRGTDCRGAARLADGADRVVRPYKAEQVRNGTSYPKGICSAALHCRTPSPTERDRTCRRAGPACPAAGYAFFGGTHGSRPTGAYPPKKQRGAPQGTPSPTGGAMWASSSTARRRGVPYRRRSQDMLATARPPMRTVTAPSFSYRTLRISDGRDMCSPCRNTFSSPGFTSPRR